MIRHRAAGAGILLLVTLILGYHVLKVTLNADFSTYLRQDDPVVQRYNYIGEEYANKSIALVLIEADDIFNTQTLTLIHDLTDAYENLDGVAYVTSLTHVLDFKKTNWGLEVGKLIPPGDIPESAQALKNLKNYVLSKEMYVRDLVSEDATSTVIAIRLKHGVYEYNVTKDIKKATEAITGPTDPISYGGMPFLMYHMTLNILDALKRLEPVMIFLMVLILFLGFRKVGGVVMPLLVVSISVIWIMGLMSLLDIPLTMLTGIMPIILIAMGSADGIHVMRRYYDKTGIGKKPLDAVKETFSELGTPITMTTITTMIGFSSLLISNFSVIQQFGLVTALGVFVALMVTFLLVPFLLALSKPKSNKQTRLKNFLGTKFMDRWAETVFRNKVPIVLLTGLIVIASAVIIPQLKKDVDWSLCLKKGSKAHRAEMLLRRDFGGTLPVQALVKGDIKDPATLKAMRYLERYLETVPSVGESQSMAGLISEMNDVMNDRYVVPGTKEGVTNLWFLIEGEEIVEQLVKADTSEGIVQAKVDTWDGSIVAEAMNNIDQFITALPEKIRVIDIKEAPAGIKKVLLEIQSAQIVENLMRDIAKRGIQADAERLKTIVKTMLSATGLNPGEYSGVRRKIVNYLRSDEAELESISQVTATAIAADIVKEMKPDADIQPNKIAAIAQSKIGQTEVEDLKALAQSLKMVTREAFGEARVAAALENISALLPPGAERMRDLYRDLKGDLWAVTERLVALGPDEYRRLALPAATAVVRQIPVSFESSGLASVLKRMEEELLPSQMLSLFLAIIFTAVATAVIFRSISLGLIGMMPISLTILTNFAVMALLDVSLDSFTSMVASVAIGLGIDTDIHFISCFKREFSRLGDELKALKKTLSTTGRAILINALTVGLGFAVLLLAGGQHARRFGGLVALTVILSALFTFTVLPAVILLVKPKFFKKEKQKSDLPGRIQLIGPAGGHSAS